MRKEFFLFSAIIWTGVILFLSLENSKNIPQIEIPNIDKVIHFGFHFVFTILWFLYLKKRFNSSKNLHLLIFTLIVSFVFGIAIELLQQYFTATRNADVFDILANTSGALTAAFLIMLVNTYNGLIDKI